MHHRPLVPDPAAVRAVLAPADRMTDLGLEVLAGVTVAVIVGIVATGLMLWRRVGSLTEQAQRVERDQRRRHDETQAELLRVRADLGLVSVRLAELAATHGAAIGELRGRLRLGDDRQE